VPRGGALVLCRDLVLYYTQGGHSALAVNSGATGGAVPRKVDFSGMVGGRSSQAPCPLLAAAAAAAAAGPWACTRAGGLLAEVYKGQVAWRAAGAAVGHNNLKRSTLLQCGAVQALVSWLVAGWTGLSRCDVCSARVLAARTVRAQPRPRLSHAGSCALCRPCPAKRAWAGG
jgi:hypothetical protein